MEAKNNRYFDETRLSFKDFCWRLLEQWKAIVIVVVCITAFLIGLMYFRNTKNGTNAENNQSSKQPETVEEIIDGLPENEQAVVESGYRLLQERKQLADYIKNAPVMKIDPNQYKRLQISWSVNADEKDIHAIIQMYVVELKNEKRIQTILDDSGIDLDVKSFKDSIQFHYPNEAVSDIICLDIVLTEDIDAEKLQEEMRETIEDINRDFENEFGVSQIRNYKSDIDVGSNRNMFVAQISYLNYFSNLNSQLINLKNNLTAGQKEAFAKIETIDSQTEVAKQPEAPIRTFTFRNVLIGIIFGILIYIILYFLYMMMTNKVMSADSLKEGPVRTLGEWYAIPSDQKREGLIRDSFFGKKHHNKHLNSDEEINRIADSVESFCRYKGMKSAVLVITAKLSKRQSVFIDNLTQRISMDSLDLEIMESDQNFINDSLLVKTDGVVLVVVEARTRLKDLEMAINRCNDYETAVIGSVYLG